MLTVYCTFLFITPVIINGIPKCIIANGRLLGLCVTIVCKRIYALDGMMSFDLNTGQNYNWTPHVESNELFSSCMLYLGATARTGHGMGN